MRMTMSTTMDAIYLIYFLLAALLLIGAKFSKRSQWNDEAFSLGQFKMLQGFAAVCIMFHHMSQKTCAPWHDQKYIIHGLDPFVQVGYYFVGIFLFCSGFGLYKSWKSKPGYLKGFPQKRILPIVIAFYLSEWICLGVRALMGQKLSGLQVLWYALGLQLANTNAWYVIVIPFFYLFFFLAFKYCKREGAAILWVFAAVLAYTLAGTLIDHNDWWMVGEWWYNAVLLFPLGILFAKCEKRFFGAMKKHAWIYWSLLLLAFAGTFGFYKFSEWMKNTAGYYGETWGDPLKVPHRWMCVLSELLASGSFVWFVMLASMKVRIGNKLLGILGKVTLELYLIHGIFVEMFGYNFEEVAKSVVYIKDVGLYVLVVIACAAVATVLFRLLYTGVLRLTGLKKPEKAIPENTDAAKAPSGV